MLWSDIISKCWGWGLLTVSSKHLVLKVWPWFFFAYLRVKRRKCSCFMLMAVLSKCSWVSRACMFLLDFCLNWGFTDICWGIFKHVLREKQTKPKILCSVVILSLWHYLRLLQKWFKPLYLKRLKKQLFHSYSWFSLQQILFQNITDNLIKIWMDCESVFHM